MSKKKLIKSKTIPEKKGVYDVFLKNSGYIRDFEFDPSSLNQAWFWARHVLYHIQEVPDREEEMREMLEELLNSSYVTIRNDDLLKKIKQLLNK